MIYNGNEYAFILTLLNDMRLIMILKYDDDKDLKIFDYFFFLLNIQSQCKKIYSIMSKIYLIRLCLLVSITMVKLRNNCCSYMHQLPSKAKCPKY